MSAKRRSLLINPMERLLVFNRSPFFSGLPEGELETLARLSREFTWRKGEVLLTEDTPARWAYMIVEGALDVFREGIAPQRVVAPFGVGPYDIFGRTEGGARIVAAVDTVTLGTHADVFTEVLEDHFNLFHRVIVNTTRELIEDIKKIDVDRQVPKVDHPTCQCPGRRFDLVERMLFLRRMPLFARSSMDSVTEFAKALQEVRYPAGTRLWSEGDASDTMLFVVQGKVSATRSGSSAVTAYGPYSTVGALAAIAAVPRWQTCVTETPLITLEADAGRFIDVLEDNSEMGLDFLAGLSMETLDVRRQLHAHRASRAA